MYKKNEKVIRSVCVILTLFFCISIVASCSNLPWWYIEDNPVEEEFEDWINDQTGLDIDLTPNSEEK